MVVIANTRLPIALESGATGTSVAWQCLSRRGMLFSEIEGFEYLRLAPGARYEAPVHPHTEQIVVVAHGSGTFSGSGLEQAIEERDLIMLPHMQDYVLGNPSAEDLELLLVDFLPNEAADLLPPRLPMMLQTETRA